jgi:HicB_like antitoxin of bacterial toxin-antitoxin system
MDDAGEECVVIRNNVTLPRRTLRRLDDDARAAGETRSGYTAKLAIGR